MAKGLSEIQKSILATLSELDNSRRHYFYAMNELKVKLYPDLYFFTEGPGYKFIHTVRHGVDQNKKRVARVVISRSIQRLVKRNLLYIDSNYVLTVNVMSTIDKALTNKE